MTRCATGSRNVTVASSRPTTSTVETAASRRSARSRSWCSFATSLDAPTTPTKPARPSRTLPPWTAISSTRRYTSRAHSRSCSLCGRAAEAEHDGGQQGVGGSSSTRCVILLIFFAVRSRGRRVREGMPSPPFSSPSSSFPPFSPSPLLPPISSLFYLLT